MALTTGCVAGAVSSHRQSSDPVTNGSNHSWGQGTTGNNITIWHGVFPLKDSTRPVGGLGLGGGWVGGRTAPPPPAPWATKQSPDRDPFPRGGGLRQVQWASFQGMSETKGKTEGLAASGTSLFWMEPPKHISGDNQQCETCLLLAY